MIRKKIFTGLLLTIVTTTQLLAHSVWIEPIEGGQLVIRFAEPSGKLEKSPGYLDSLSVPMTFTVVTNTPAALTAPKKSDHFLLTGASPTNPACAETSFTVRAKRKPIFYARWQPTGAAASPPLLTLDVVLTDKPGEARAYFRGQPLGNIKATLHTPKGDELEVTADTEGFLRYTAKDPGQYLLTIAHHRESLAGFHNGVAYEQTSHNCSVTWEQK